jgi:hypothetical protein
MRTRIQTRPASCSVRDAMALLSLILSKLTHKLGRAAAVHPSSFHRIAAALSLDGYPKCQGV